MMRYSLISIILFLCRMRGHSRRDYRPSITEAQGFIQPSSSYVVPASFTTTTNYIVRVGSTNDGSANPGACSSSSSIALSSCNLRSAWALCQLLITAVTCPSSGSQSTMLTCAIVLPGMSTIQMLKTYGSNGLDVSGLSSWASSCQNTQVSLSIASPTSTRSAIITGDSSSAPLLILQNIPFMDLTMENVTITGFGDGSTGYPGIVLLSSIRSARFAHMQIGPKNIVFATSAIMLQSLSSSASIVHSKFVGNALNFVYNILSPYNFGAGGALQLLNMNNVLISGCSFVSNYAVFANVGGALGIISSTNVAIVATSFVNNSVLTRYGWAGALYINYAKNISISTSRFDGNTLPGGDGSGGALYASFSSFINIVDTSFTNNTALDAGGAGGALSIYHVTNTLIKRCTFTGNSAQEGGGISLGRSVMFDMIEVHASGNAAVQRDGTNPLLLVNSGNGGFLWADNDNSHISIVKSTFVGNTAAVGGGAFYFGFNNTFIALTNLTFMKNVAVSGSGGAVYMGSSNQFVSIGGALPARITNPVEGPQVPFTLRGGTLARGNLRVVGFYTVFDPSIVGTCDCIVHIGTYVNGAPDPTCDVKKGWDASHMPGMNGKPPSYVNQTDIIDNYISAANGRINAVLAPLVVATGPHGEDIIPTLSFVGNQAGISGGAVYLSKQHNFVFFMRGNSFIQNKVTNSAGSGGAIYIGNQNQNIFLYANIFKGNKGSLSGGAVAISSSNFVINFYDCVFVSNTAQQGGAISMYQNNGDQASKDGNQTITNGVQLSGGSISNNNALRGGGIFIYWENVMLLQGILISGNVAEDRGGAVFVDMGFQSLYMNSVTFSNNRAGTSGGAISSDADDTGTPNAANLLTLQGKMIFQGNSAGSMTRKGYGGALAVTTSSLIFATDMQLIVRNNTADGGSAILLVSTSISAVSTIAGPGVTMVFADNVCQSEGGTVYWIRSTNHSKMFSVGPLLQPTGSNTNGGSITWTNNHAPLSQRIATQPTILQNLLASLTVMLSQYGSFIRPSPSFQLVDSFGIVNSTDFASSVIVTVKNYNCGNGHIGYLSGVQTVQVVAGVATFDSLSAFCYPGGNMTLQFTAQLSGLESYHSLSETVMMDFRSCLVGEILVINQCVQCPSGSYSFSTNQAAQCTPCPPNADGCSGATIDVSPGYWRPSTYSKVFLPCPFPSGCIGGNGSSSSNIAGSQTNRNRRLTAIDGCAGGFQGPLCGVCASGYFLNLGTKECQVCQGGNAQSQMATLVLVPFFLLMFAMAMVFYKNSFLCLPVAANEDSEETTIMARILQMIYSLSYDIVMPKFKIVVTAYQILSTFPESLSLSLTTSHSQVLRSLSYFVNLLAAPGSPQCYAAHYDYVDRLMLATISPIVICAIIPLTFGLHYKYLKRRGEDFRPIVSYYVSMFLLITYTVLPSVCTVIFGTFSSCRNIDPEGLLGTYSLYHPKDFSISCNSSRYYFGISWASVMLLIYPVGIPCLYLYLLFLARAEIILGKEKQITASTSKTLKDNSVRIKSRGNSLVLSNRGNSFGRETLNNSNNGRDSQNNSGGRVPPSMNNSGRVAPTRSSKGGSYGSVKPLPDDRLTMKDVPVVEQSTDTVSTAVKKPKDKRTKAEKLLGEVTASANKKAEKLLGTVITAANNHAAKILSEESMLKYMVSELEFLHRDYRASHWYWEIVLTYGKLLMTAVISIIYPGTLDQVVIAWIFAFLLMRVQTMYSPYLDHYDDSLKKIADYQVLLFLFIAIIKHGNVISGTTWSMFLNVVMFFLIFSSPVAAFWYAFIAPSESVASLRKNYREEKARKFLEQQSETLKDAMNTGNLVKRGPSRRSMSSNKSGNQQYSLGDFSQKSEDIHYSSQRELKMFPRKSLPGSNAAEDMDKLFNATRTLGGGGAADGTGTGAAQKYNSDYVDVDEKCSEKSSVGSISVNVIDSSKKELALAQLSAKSSDDDDSGISEKQTSQMSTTISRQHSNGIMLSNQRSSSKSNKSHPSHHKVFVVDHEEEFGPEKTIDQKEDPLSSAIPSPTHWPHNLPPLSHTTPSS